MALQGYNCNIKVASNGVAMTDEATTTSDNISYQITDSAKRIVDLNTAITVKDGGTATTEKYTFNYITGTVTFTSADAGRDARPPRDQRSTDEQGTAGNRRGVVERWRHLRATSDRESAENAPVDRDVSENAE